MEKEEKISKNNGQNNSLDADKGGNLNEAFEKVGKRGVDGNTDAPLSEPVVAKKTTDVGVSVESVDFHDRDIRFIDAERQQTTTEYLNGRYNHADERNDGKFFYKNQDIINRPSDEVDTPRFPTTRDNMIEPTFPKFINPSVKIMRVDRDYDDNNFETRGR